MWNKVAMNPDHEFALVVLTKGADWVSQTIHVNGVMGA